MKFIDDMKWIMGFLAIVLVFLYIVFQIISFVVYTDEQNINEKQIKKDAINKLGKELEQHKFYLKETKVDTLISGSMKGSFLFVGGSIYGDVSENKYLNVVYFDNDIIIDNTTEVYRITKFNLENIEIITIPKNETPYYKYIGNSWQMCDFGEYCDYKIKIGNPRLFLSEGWAILNN